MVNRTNGSSALKDDYLVGLTRSNVSNPTAKIINIDNYRNTVEKKIAEISRVTSESLNGDQNLGNELKSKIRSIISEDEIKTKREEINDLAEIISKNLRGASSSEVKIEAKKIRIEIDKWSQKNTEVVNDFKKEEFKNKFERETKKLNPNLKSDELNRVKEYSELIAENYFNKNEIDGYKDEALESNNQQYSPGQLENAWTDLKGVTNFLKKTPEQIKEVKEKYNSIKDGLKEIKLPNLKEVRSFENVTSILNNGGVSELLSKTALKVGQNLVEKIGNQAVREFATNALGQIAQSGFKDGATAILKGILSGGVKAAATGGGAVAAAGGAVATAATGGTAAIAIAAMAVAKKVKEIGGKIAEKLGIGGKKFLEENFGKIGGKILGGILSLLALPLLAMTMAVASVAVIGSIVVGVIGGLFGYQIVQGGQVSSLVPPKGTYEQEIVEPINNVITTIIDIGGIKNYAASDQYILRTDGNGYAINFLNPFPSVNKSKTAKRSDIIATAISIIGVPYYYGGGHGWVIPNHSEPVSGIDSYWGTRVSVDNLYDDDGNKIGGRNRTLYGLDCSGFVTWVYYQVTGININGTATDLYVNSTHIDEADLQPGDIGVVNPDGEMGRNHVGIYLGTYGGQKYFIHAGPDGGNVPDQPGSVQISAYPFKYFGRITTDGINVVN